MQLVLFKRIQALFYNIFSLEGLFRLGNPSLGKTHSSAHPFKINTKSIEPM